ncbi:hypothetical protein CUN63_09795 [Pseudomonas sp. ACM7]|nr:hypothetical protein CUN63_09795 [Pseudomonas sp. ACM7]
MADGGGPPEQCRSEGMPSLSEAPNGGARALGYLGLGGIPYFQVTRCKSETASSRYRRNGYVPHPIPSQTFLKVNSIAPCAGFVVSAGWKSPLPVLTPSRASPLPHSIEFLQRECD